MEKWLRERLSNCLNFEVPDDMIKYAMSIQSSEEFDEYFDTLLNKECDDHRLFLADFKRRLFSKALPNKKTNKPYSQGSAPIKQHMPTNKQDRPAEQGAKKKNKFVSLYTNDGSVIGETILLKGRKHCDCQATQHKLINNCLSCGRIVCEQEGSGPCLFCGEIVCTNDEQQVLKNTNGKKAENLLKSLVEKGGGESLKKAMEQRDRLLEYDRNSEKRTTVIDDELDYFQENSVWLSDAEREKFARLKEEMQNKKHASRAQRSIKIDFAGREIEDNVLSEEYERSILKEITVQGDANNWSNSKHTGGINESLDTDPNMDSLRPIYTSTNNDNQNAMGRLSHSFVNSYNRVQDKQLLEMQDMRHCLSMHQPWASLLIAGIKKHEGRVWYSEHRGRLWIASTAKSPHTEEIQEIENFYKKYYNDDKLEFPKNYPTGCLLGCVKVEDWLPQEEYREQYPNGESESPYVVICSCPEELPVVFPIKGQHKIYNIDPKIHNAACKTLLRAKCVKQ